MSFPCPPADENVRRPSACAIVLFGATGDLTRRKLIPALYSLHLKGHLPQNIAIVAFARRDKTDDEFRDDLRQAIAKFASSLPSEGEEWDRFGKVIQYHRSDLDDISGYRALKTRLDDLDEKLGLAGNRLFYLATPPDNFAQIAEKLGESGLVHKDVAGSPWARIVVEKPFGYDLESARRLNEDLRANFSEEQVYRIDHYLGKETVQNILVLRFANRLFELLWNHLYIDNVQITVAETLGMEGRGAYFNDAGVLRDIIQNHALQILTLIAMEPPVSLDADAVRDEKVKVLRSIRPIARGQVNENTVRGQYQGTSTTPGFRQEEGIPPSSNTDTFAAMRLWVDNWRWAGVPFYIRAGKRMGARITKVDLQLREVPDVLFARLACSEVLPNRITIRVQPDEGVDIFMSAKEPGPSVIVGPVRMHFDYSEAFHKVIPDAYERLILNALLGDASLFARDDEVEEAWALITPILEAWNDDGHTPQPYNSGSWGPRESDALLELDGRCWWNAG